MVKMNMMSAVNENQAMPLHPVAEFLRTFSLEITPRHLDKIDTLAAHLRPGTQVYVAMIEAMAPEIEAALRGESIPPDPTLEERRRCMVRHYERVVARFGESKGTLLMRKYACCYAQGMRGARNFRAQIGVVQTREQFYQIVEDSFPRSA